MRFLLPVLLAGAATASLALPGSARADDEPPPITVRPHLQGADGLHLEQQGDDEDEWTKVCDAPCDRPVRLDRVYRVAGGPDIAPSGDFQLHGRFGERVLVTVDRTTTVRRETGKAILIGGVVGIGAGVTLFSAYAIAGLAAAVSNTDCAVAGSFGATTTSVSASGSASCGNASAPKALLWTGVGAMSLGVAALVAGLVIMTPTSAQQGPIINVDAPAEDRWAPTPQVNGPASLRVPPGQSFSVISGSF